MGTTRGALSRVLDKLEAKKLMSRLMNPLDSRVQILSLTSNARRILPRLTRIADDHDNRFFVALGSDEQVSLRHLLRKLAEIHRITRIPLNDTTGDSAGAAWG